MATFQERDEPPAAAIMVELLSAGIAGAIVVHDAALADIAAVYTDWKNARANQPTDARLDMFEHGHMH